MPTKRITLSDGAPRDDDPIVLEFDAEAFECLDDQPAQSFLDYNAAQGDTGALVAFVRACMLPDDAVRFDSLLASKDRIVNAAHVSEAAAWLIEVYAGRPTRRPAESSDGQQTNGASSAASSSGTASTPQLSAVATS